MSGERDPLERATRALREATPPTQDELAAGRARLLAAHRGAVKSSRARTLRWVLPLAAMLAAGTALAATPEAFERLARAVTSLLATDASKLASHPKLSRRKQAAEAPRPTPVPSAVEVAAPSASAVAEPAVAQHAPAVDEAASASAQSADASHAEQTARAARRQRRAWRAEAERVEPANVKPEKVEPAPAPVAAVEPEPAPEPVADADLASYREAHRQHFRLRNYAAALRSWDDYLRGYPHGTFAIEARYNRAICLVHLGKKDEARSALAPFAEGDEPRRYRQAEAIKLLEALE